MKGRFLALTQLTQLEETMRQQEAYAVLVVSTTGLDDNDFNEHSPIRVVLKSFEFDNQTGAYQPAVTFDRMVQAPQTAISKALESESYDAFANGGIDREAYLRGENVASLEDFQKEFKLAIAAIHESGATLIGNNSSFCVKYLEKIGCSEELNAMQKENKLLDQTRLTSEYFQLHGIKGTNNLENLRDTMLPDLKGSFYQDAGRMKDFKSMSKDDFLEAHKEVSAREYEITQKDVDRRGAKIIGGDNRASTINAFVTKYGREKGILDKEILTHMKESEVAYMQDLVDKGKQKYTDADISDKFDTLIKRGTIDPDAIKKGEGAFQRLMDAVENGDNKGILIMHCATAGADFRKGDKGEPIQFAALVYQRGDDGSVDMTQRPQGAKLLIQASDKAIQKAVQEKEKGNYDTFARANIDFEQYRNGVGVSSKEEAAKTINDFFSKKAKAEDYTIVTIGGDFSQRVLEKLGNFTVCNQPIIDATKAMQEYIYLAMTDNKYPENALFSPDKLTGKNMSLEGIAEMMNYGSTDGTITKCRFVAKVIEALEQQQIELFRPEELNKETAKAPASTKEADTHNVANGAVNSSVGKGSGIGVPMGATVGADGTMDEQDYDDFEEEFSSEELEMKARIESEVFQSLMSDAIGSPAPSASQEHGKLYSDKKGDTRDVFVPNGGVTKVGTVEVPHVSEALKNKEPVNEDTSRFRRRPDTERETFAQRRARLDAERKENTSEKKIIPIPEKTVPSPSPAPVVDSFAITALSKVIEEQAKQIRELQEDLRTANTSLEKARQDNMVLADKLIAALTDNQVIMKNMANSIALANEASEHVLSDTKGDPIASIESLKEEVSKMREQMPSSASSHLLKANGELSEAQKAIEKEKENKQKVS